MITFDYQDGEIVSSPTIIVSGHTSSCAQGVIEFINNNNKVFPPQNFEVNAGFFKAILHVSPGELNKFAVKVYSHAQIDAFGFRNGSNTSVDSGSISFHYNESPNNKVIHLCLILGKDSNGSYDMPKYRLQRGEVANLDTAIKKLKVAARLMQAFTMKDMREAGFLNRTFPFAEERVSHQSIFGYNVNSPTPHNEVKIHVIRSDRTVAQLRDLNWAQQNPQAKDKGALFGHAMDLVKKNPEIWSEHERRGTAVQCACIYLDSTWDTKHKLILTHAALGGGGGDIKMAIFGSHGLHSWPSTFPAVTPSFLDATHLSTNEVANDCNECGTSWECCNITMGAFMHEIGHLLGLPHEVDGVMLRDYVWWNRSFMTRENECLRRKTGGARVDGNGEWDKVCHWHRCDQLRFLYHGSFSLPPDDDDPSFGKISQSTILPNKNYNKDGRDKPPVYYISRDKEIVVYSNSGIYFIDWGYDGLTRYHREFLPLSYGGKGLPNKLTLKYDDIWNEFRNGTPDHRENFNLSFHALGGDLSIDNVKEVCMKGPETIKSDFGLNRGEITGYLSRLEGRKNGQMIVASFNWKKIYKVRVYHGHAVFGIKFFYKSCKDNRDKPPPTPARNYGKFKQLFKKQNLSQPTFAQDVNEKLKESMIGNEAGNHTDFELGPQEFITKFNFRSGAWIDAIQIVTNQNRASAMFGSADGGGFSFLDLPQDQTELIGLYGYKGDWLDGLGIIYAFS